VAVEEATWKVIDELDAVGARPQALQDLSSVSAARPSSQPAPVSRRTFAVVRVRSTSNTSTGAAGCAA
jgi:hypothetical protein